MIPRVRSVAVTLLIIAAGGAAPPSPVLPPDADRTLAARVSAAVGSAPELAGLSLTVDVLNKVAVVGGPVPDEVTAGKVRATVEAVPGLAGVKLSTWVPAPTDGLTRRVLDRLSRPEGEAGYRAEKPATAVPVPAEVPLIIAPWAGRKPAGRLVPPLLAARRPDADPAAVTTVRHYEPPPAGVRLLDPVAAPTPAADPVGPRGGRGEGGRPAV